MNKEHFNQLVTDYSELEDQFKDLELLIKEFPYSQPVRMLNVKSSSVVSKNKFQERLSLAAFYTTDRNVLRSLIEQGKVPSDSAPANIATAKKKKSRPAIKTPTPLKQKKLQRVSDAEALRNEVLKNLELLRKQKQSFLKLDELPSSKKRKTVEKQKKESAKKVSPAAPITPKKVNKQSNRSNKRELIDKFIADEPTITPKKPMRENQSDLSKASSELKEDLVSENLAIIFARQGKTSKAIDIYKKLIWKFPQKKASFAAQIEVLKKKKG